MEFQRDSKIGNIYKMRRQQYIRYLQDKELSEDVKHMFDGRGCPYMKNIRSGTTGRYLVKCSKIPRPEYQVSQRDNLIFGEKQRGKTWRRNQMMGYPRKLAVKWHVSHRAKGSCRTPLKSRFASAEMPQEICRVHQTLRIDHRS